MNEYNNDDEKIERIFDLFLKILALIFTIGGLIGVVFYFSI